MKYRHVPVLLKESLDGLEVKPGGKYIDGTFGGGGHTRGILERGGSVLCLDEDSEALKNAGELIEIYGKERLRAVRGNFRNLADIAGKLNFGSADGVLLDLGISSYQIDNPDKGFSYRFENADLDMRFDSRGPVRALDILNKAGREEMYEIFSRYGEEKYSGAIADSVLRARKIKQFEKTGDLLAVLRNTESVKYDNRMAARIFQSLRIAVNRELENLEKGLKDGTEILKTGGRLAVISYHSLEDRMVKNMMRKSWCRQIFKHPVTAKPEEIRQNPRSRSAKLRIAIKN